MKKFNEDHEAIIISEWVEVKIPKGVKEGDAIPHKPMVDIVKMYEPTYDRDGFQNGVKETVLTRRFILDMYEEITNIESEVKDMPYQPLPF